MAETSSKLASTFWPTIADPVTAHRIARQGFWAAVFVAVVTAVLALLSLFGVNILNLDAWAFLDAAVFAVIAFGILKESRTAAVAGFVLFVAERIVMWLEAGSAQGWILSVIIALAFLNAARATFALRRFARLATVASAESVSPR